MHVRVCRECDEEYRPDISVCADCGAELVDHYEDERGQVIGADGLPVPEPAVAGEHVTVELQPLFSGLPNDIKPLADALVAAGIPMRLVPAQYGAGLVLAVASADAERAGEALASFAERASDLGLTRIAPSDATAEDAAGYAACPACQGALPPRAVSCPECGLELGGSEEP
jgi:hypothetical protein